MIDTTVHPGRLIRAAEHEVRPILADLPVFTIEHALRMARSCGMWRRPVPQMLLAEIRRRTRASEIRTPTTITIPPFYEASPAQLRGGLLMANVTVKQVARVAGVSPGAVYSVINGTSSSDHIALVITRAIAGRLHEKDNQELK